VGEQGGLITTGGLVVHSIGCTACGGVEVDIYVAQCQLSTECLKYVQLGCTGLVNHSGKVGAGIGSDTSGSEAFGR
jgi:hypothetical protein